MGTGTSKSENLDSNINPNIGDSNYSDNRFIVFRNEVQEEFLRDLASNYQHCYDTNTDCLAVGDYISESDIPPDFLEDLQILREHGIDIEIPGANNSSQYGNVIVDIKSFLMSKGYDKKIIDCLCDYISSCFGEEPGNYVVDSNDVYIKYRDGVFNYRFYADGDDSLFEFYDDLSFSHKKALHFMYALHQENPGDYYAIGRFLTQRDMDSSGITSAFGQITTRLGVRTVRKLIDALDVVTKNENPNSDFRFSNEENPLFRVSFYPTVYKDKNTVAYYSPDYNGYSMIQSLNPFFDYNSSGYLTPDTIPLSLRSPGYTTGGDPISTISHEFGHYIDYHIKRRNSYGYSFNKIQGSQAVSPYGNKNEKEAFAEAFACYTTGRTPWQGQEYYDNFCTFMQENGLSAFKDCLKGELF